MPDPQLKIAHFRPEHESGVLGLLGILWKYDKKVRRRLFRWKYLENPSSDGPLGIVALHDDRVVGFRGYFANRFVLGPNGDHIRVLHPGDTCVNPHYRNRGLSVAMGSLAMQYDTLRYRLFVNMTCSPNSLPGYLKMSFRPLVSRIRLVRGSPNPLSWLRNRKGRIHWPRTASRVRLGQSGNILVTDAPRPDDMASTVSDHAPAEAVLRLQQDQAFFAWRYRNPVNRYVFYFLMAGSAVRGFLVVGVAPTNLSGEILDYAARDAETLREILDFIDRSRHYVVLSVYRYGSDAVLQEALKDRGFAAAHPLDRLISRASPAAGALPVLIRPIAKSYTDDDFKVGGVDLRNFDNWHLKPICADGA